MKKCRWLILTLLLAAALSVTAFAAEGDIAVDSAEARWEEFPDLTPIQPAQPATRGLLRGAPSGTSEASIRDAIKNALVEALNSALNQGYLPIRTFSYTNAPSVDMAYVEIDLAKYASFSSDQVQSGAVNQAYLYALFDYPEETYCFGISPNTAPQYMIDAQNNVTEYVIYAPVAIDVLDDGKDAAYHAALDQACEEAFGISKSNPTSPLSAFEKVVAAHDWIATNCFYDPYVSNGEQNYQATAQDPFDNAVRVDDRFEYRYNACSWTSYGVFVNHMAVCQGYALALEAMLDRAGVPCVYVSSNPLNHAWNMVQLGVGEDAKWYHVDATWDDPVDAGTVQRQNLLLSDTDIRSAKDRNGRDKQGHEPNGCVQKYDGTLPGWVNDDTRPWAKEPDDNIWTTEGGYTCGSTYPVPELLTNSTLPVYLYKDNSAAGALYMVSGKKLYTFEAGKNFADNYTSTAELSHTDTLVNGFTEDVFSTAMDYRNGVIYAMEKVILSDDNKPQEVGAPLEGSQTMRTIELKSPLAMTNEGDYTHSFSTVASIEENTYYSYNKNVGIWLYDRSAAVQGLCITYNYGALHYWMIGLAQTDDAMPVVVQYSPDMQTVSDVNDYKIFFRQNGEETNYIALLACYNGDGRMLSFTGLDVQDEDGAADLGDVTIPADTATVKIFVVSADDATYGKPLSEVLMLPSAASP